MTTYAGWPPKAPGGPTRVYLSASMRMVEQMRLTARNLRQLGLDVVSTWHDEPARTDDPDGWGPIAEEMALRCLSDLEAADAVIMFSRAPSSTGGAHLEVGYAMALGRRVVVVGPRPSIFYHLVPSVQGLAEALRLLASPNTREEPHHG